LDSQGLAHHRATTSDDLEVRHGTSAGTEAGTGSRGKSTQSGGRGALEERTHRPRLLEKRLHGDGGERASRDSIEARIGFVVLRRKVDNKQKVELGGEDERENRNTKGINRPG
jgi:hypothetical protein